MDDEYTAINVDILGLTSRAVHVRCADNVRRWIPRSLVYGPDETTLSKHVGQLVEISVFRWFTTKNAIPLARKTAAK